MARHLRADRKEQRQESAAIRQAQFDALTPQQKYEKTEMLRYLVEA